jgi:broad specificity phosphatase PhoE
MPKLFLVRHGETRKNLDESLHSADDPEELNETGRRQIARVCDFLKPFAPFKLYCSKEKRAQQSAKLIAENLGVSLTEIRGLQERNWGAFTGKTWKEVRRLLDPMNVEDRYTFVPGEGESWKSFEERLIAAVKKIISNEDSNIVIVTHGGAIRALMPFLLSLPKEESFKYDFDNASITLFNFDENGFKKEFINKTVWTTLR